MGVFTTEGRLIRLNPSWEIILGYKTEELLKMGWAQLVHPDDVERTNKEVEKQLKGSPVVNFVNRYKCKDDSYKTLEWQATFAKNGIVTATARDITEYKWLQHDLDERKCAEEVLRESEGEYNALHNNMLNGFAHCKMLFDENNQPIDFIYLDVNDAFERLTGLRREDVIDRRVTEAIPGIKESHHELLIIYGKVASTGEATSFDLYFKPLKIWLTISVYSTQKGYFIAVFENITKRKQAEERIKTLRPTPEKLIPLEDRFQKYGLKDFSGPEKIRLLLCHNLPRKEGEKLVNEVTKRYKTLRELLTAPDRELGQIPGITPRTLLCIKLMKEMPKAFLREKIINKHVHKSSRDIFDYLYYSMRSITNEILKVLYLDSQNKIIAIEDMFKGTLDSIHIYPREIEAGAIGHNATGLVFVHNHPSGDPAPSKNDRKITRDLVFIGQVLQIKVVDHIIIGGDNYFSFADVGLITKYEDEFLNLRIRSLALRK